MPFSLLKVEDNLALEFDTSDLVAVRKYLRQTFPEMNSQVQGIEAVVTFGGEDFIFQNEWDDPCLVSISAKGNNMLRALYEHFRDN